MPAPALRAVLKQRAKRGLEGILARSWQPVRRRRAVVLCYHSIHPSLPFASATPDLFRHHLRWLREHCEVVPLRALLTHTPFTNGARPMVAITFDDGYQDNYTHAFPVLREESTVASFFVATGLIDADPRVVRTLSELYGVSRESVIGLSWPQILEMRHAGMEFGAHTHTHPNLSCMEGAKAAADIRTSKDILEEHLQEPILAFAYPFGKPRMHFNARTIAMVANLAFECAVAIHYRGIRPSDCPFSVPRFAVTNDPLEILAAKVYGKLDVLGFWQEWAPVPLARLIADDPSRMLELVNG